MFIIKVNTKLANNQPLHDALTLLSLYKVSYHSLYIRKGSIIEELVVVDKETRKGDLRLAEMAFQMNSKYEQEGFVCPICKKKSEDFCGHLIFVPR